MTDPRGEERRAARVLLLDGDFRVLLLRFAFAGRHVSEFGEYGWCAPGGGVEPGESLAEAAAREVGEELGLAVAPADLGPPVAYIAGFADLGWARGLFRDYFFVLRVAAFQPDTGGMLEGEAAFHAGHRWWAPAELVTPGETVIPYGLAGLVTELAAGRRPVHAVELPWHHGPADR
ncbi:NUDIX hydrolase [Asanoa iriomotensis]|uniref:DNA mismatch repair protein MutT n=1 Tax=Asanoa iriomotensis TaxID=234613 RepID=A0ABQ4CFM2_9ACTN|nr:NUDIX domain-containing protein [Asanoa iriomotensis]GIF61566.1 DNA mismatch repair protein MutT [Asanoa iriomotensis]